MVKGAITVQEATHHVSTLQIPLQSAPIDRTSAGVAAFRDAAGVEASWGFSDIWDAVKTYGPTVLDAVKTYGPAVAAAL